MAGKASPNFKLIHYIYSIFITLSLCKAAFVPPSKVSAVTEVPNLNHKSPLIEASIHKIQPHQCINFYRAQNTLGIRKQSNNVAGGYPNCSQVEHKNLPLDLTKDGYLQVENNKDNAKMYYPPSQFCIATK